MRGEYGGRVVVDTASSTEVRMVVTWPKSTTAVVLSPASARQVAAELLKVATKLEDRAAARREAADART
jgi:acetyl-CoA carboxylase carboxyltransferase component